MVTIQIKDKQYDVPTKWNEVTLKQYVQLNRWQKELTAVRLLSIVTGIEYDTISNLPCTEFSIKVMPEMEWLSEELNPLNVPRCKHLTIDGKKIKVIYDVSQERFGQKLFMQQLVAKAIEQKSDHAELVASVVSNYYAPYLHPQNKWDEKHVKETEQLIYDLPVLEVYPEADFFLRGYIQFVRPKAKR